MKIRVRTITEVEAATLEVIAHVRYWEDSKVNGVEDEEGSMIPCRVGDSWRLSIDIDTGIIADWPKAVEADVHYKVCDRCDCLVLSADNEVLEESEGYVPDVLSPKENGYSDYIIMNIDCTGKISDWNSELLYNDIIKRV
jgi:hypothetical protein